jgi:hypothetical protein
VVLAVLESGWTSIGQSVYGNGAGYFTVSAKPDSTHLTVLNTGATGNVAPGTVVAFPRAVSPAGIQGVAGADGTTPTLNDISPTIAKGDLMVDQGGVSSPNVDAFGVGSDFEVLHADSTAAGDPFGMRWGAIDLTGTATDLTGALPVANGGTGAATAAGARTSLGAAASGLATASGLTLAATDKVLGRKSGGAGAVEEITCTSYGRDLLDDASVSAQRVTLGRVLPRYGLLGSKSAMDCNVPTNDNAITMESARYRIDKVVIENGSVNMTTATCGLFTAAGGGGTTLAADQSMAALSATTKFDDLTLEAVTGTDVLTAGTLYARTGTAQGLAATCNVWIFGWALD